MTVAGHQKGRWLPLWKKLRYYLVATAVLVAAGVGFFVFLRRILLVNYQSLETSMAQNYAAEVEGDLDIYKALIAVEADGLDARIEDGEPVEALTSWISRYSDRLHRLFGPGTVDNYAIYNGQVRAADPWEDTAASHYAAT